MWGSLHKDGPTVGVEGLGFSLGFGVEGVFVLINVPR